MMATHPVLDGAEAIEAYDRWADGVCPCCGTYDADDLGDGGTAPRLLAEDVMMCGQCVALGHLDPVEIGGQLVDAVARLLAAIVRGGQLSRQLAAAGGSQ